MTWNPPMNVMAWRRWVAVVSAVVIVGTASACDSDSDDDADVLSAGSEMSNGGSDSAPGSAEAVTSASDTVPAPSTTAATPTAATDSETTSVVSSTEPPSGEVVFRDDVGGITLRYLPSGYEISRDTISAEGPVPGLVHTSTRFSAIGDDPGRIVVGVTRGASYEEIRQFLQRDASPGTLNDAVSSPGREVFQLPGAADSTELYWQAGADAMATVTGQGVNLVELERVIASMEVDAVVDEGPQS